jgi:uncharacterized phage-like protein YoqJ
MSNLVVAFTGHRPDKLGGYRTPNPLYAKVCHAIEKALIELRPTKAISGMALGVDQWAANICVKLGIPFIAAIPFAGQENVWPEESKRIYRLLLARSTEQHIVSKGGYSARKLQIRNEWMVDNCNKLIAIWDGSRGGTGNCVNYAHTVNREVHRIDPSEL